MSDGLVCGEIVSCDAIEGKDKLKRLTVRVADGDDDGARLQIVTNAPNVDVGKRCVVAKIGSTLRDGTEVKKASVGGVTSEGMLCDSAMCGWSGGGAGAAALLPQPGRGVRATRRGGGAGWRRASRRGAARRC